MIKGIERKHNLSDVIESLKRYSAMTQIQLHINLLESKKRGHHEAF